MAAAQHRLAASNVGSGGSDELARGDGAADFHSDPVAAVPHVGVFDHDHRVRPARNHAAGGDQRRGAGANGMHRLFPVSASAG
jgi:hypothetical protein